MNNSIQARLLWGIGLTFSLALSLIGAIAYHQAMHEIDEVFDAQLAQNARLIGTLANNPNWLNATDKPIGEVSLPSLDETVKQLSGPHHRFLAGTKYESEIAFQVWDKQGERLLYSVNASPKTDPSTLVAGFEDLRLAGEDWVVFNLWQTSAGIWVQTAQKHRVREELSRHIALAQIYPFLLASLPLLVLIVLVIRRALHPLSLLTQAVEQRKPQDTQPIDLTLPKELHPIKTAINDLLNRMNQHLEKEKRFVADAAHELRTPLSILQIHADNMLHSETEQQKRQAAQAVYQGTQRLTHLVNQLLALARTESLDAHQMQTLDWVSVIHDSVVQLDVTLLERVDWQLNLPEQALVTADSVMLQMVMRNLFENAAKYAPQDSIVRLALKQDLLLRWELMLENCCDLCTPLQNPERLTDRFYRLPGHQNHTGSGLGLSIVQQIVNAHQGHLKLSYATIDAQRYFKVTLKLASA